MKILLDTDDVKQAIRDYAERTGIIKSDTKIEMDIVKLRTGEDLRVEITIIKDEQRDPIAGRSRDEIDEEVIDDQGEDAGANPFGDSLKE